MVFHRGNIRKLSSADTGGWTLRARTAHTFPSPKGPKRQGFQPTSKRYKNVLRFPKQRQWWDNSRSLRHPSHALAICSHPARNSTRNQDAPKSLWRRFGRALKLGLNYDLNDLFRRHQTIDGELLEEIETLLITSDVGVEVTAKIINNLNQRLARNQLADADSVRDALRVNMLSILAPVALPLAVSRPRDTPFVLLMVGVNGSGKTTTIGKLAARFKQQGMSVMLAAGDTFRAAAVEQLQEWGKNVDVPVVAQATGADSAAVIFDALESARARHVDVLIADTAGRLHTHSGLMEELKKVRRVITKQIPLAPHETMLVIDAVTGQNAMNQAKQFHQDVGVSGITLSKLDGTSKGGIVFSVASVLGLPIRFVGIGEAVEDLREFDPEEFVDAVLGK